MTRHVGAVLERAVRVLKTRGWTQDMLEDDKGRLCLIGALFHAAREDWGPLVRPGDWDNAPEVVWEVEAFLQDVHLVDYCRPPDGRVLSPAHWNDEDGRTFDEVLAMLKDAAQAWKDGRR